MQQKIIESCIDGNRFAQRRLYDSFAKKMFRLCRRYVDDEQDAEEVLMNGLLKVFKHLSEFEYQHEKSLEGWVKKIMVNECLQFLRKQKIVFTSFEHIHEEPITAIENNLEVAELYQLILALPVGYRTVFNLYAIEGYGHAEIAQQLKITEGTSKSQLSKARAMLQQKLKEADQRSKQRYDTI